jgi:hypothetical protein
MSGVGAEELFEAKEEVKASVDKRAETKSKSTILVSDEKLIWD